MDRAEQIVQLVMENPGIRYSELMRATGLKNGVLSHHLSKIEKSGKLVIERTPRVARFYPCGMSQEITLLIKHLKNPTSQKILTILLEHDLTFKEIVGHVKKSQGTVSLSLKVLADDGILLRRYDNGNLMFQLVNKSLLNTLVEKQPPFIEHTANSIADIFSSL